MNRKTILVCAFVLVAGLVAFAVERQFAADVLEIKRLTLALDAANAELATVPSQAEIQGETRMVLDRLAELRAAGIKLKQSDIDLVLEHLGSHAGLSK